MNSSNGIQEISLLDFEPLIPSSGQEMVSKNIGNDTNSAVKDNKTSLKSNGANVALGTPGSKGIQGTHGVEISSGSTPTTSSTTISHTSTVGNIESTSTVHELSSKIPHIPKVHGNGVYGIDAFYILDMKGKPLISRQYRPISDISPQTIINQFSKKVILQQNDYSDCPPIIHLDLSTIHSVASCTVAFMKHMNIYFLLITQKNANAMLMLVFLQKLKSVFTHYFKNVEEESIKDNFVVIHELLDEIIDNGFIQSTETSVLQEFIKLKAQKLNIDTKALVNAARLGMLGGNGINSLGNVLQQQMRQIVTTIRNKDASNDTSDTLTVPVAFTGKSPWRRENIFYKKNEIFLDVIENVTILASPLGQTLHSEINGVLRMKCQLSGMPDVSIALNDKVLFENIGRSSSKSRSVELEDVKFHQCVRLNRFESDRTISFLPPDGDFDLMTYRLNTRIKPLISVKCEMREMSQTRIEYMLTAKAQFKKKSIAKDVLIFVPVPNDVQTPLFKVSNGNAEYLPAKNVFRWRIPRFPGGDEYVLHAQINLPTMTSYNKKDTSKRPINIHFEIPYFTVSGLQVKNVRVVEKSAYETRPWVRYLSRGGGDDHSGIEIRM